MNTNPTVNMDGTVRLNLPKRKDMKGIEILVPSTDRITGCWFTVKCHVIGCRNYGGYWSNSGRKQKRMYDCGDHGEKNE